MENDAWMTGYFDQVEAVAEALFTLEGERRIADGEGDEAMARNRGQAIFAVLDETNPEFLRMFIRMMLMTVDLEAEEVDECAIPSGA